MKNAGHAGVIVMYSSSRVCVGRQELYPHRFMSPVSSICVLALRRRVAVNQGSNNLSIFYISITTSVVLHRWCLKLLANINMKILFTLLIHVLLWTLYQCMLYITKQHDLSSDFLLNLVFLKFCNICITVDLNRRAGLFLTLLVSNDTR